MMFPIEIMIAEYLRHNIFPPQPLQLVPVVMKCLELRAQGRTHRILDLRKFGILRNGSRFADFTEIFKDLRLDGLFAFYAEQIGLDQEEEGV